MACLPEDGDLSDLPSIQPSVQSQGEVTSNDTAAEEQYSSSFVPNAAPPATEREVIQQGMQELGQSRLSILRPSIGGTPNNEFQTEGYFSMAFPTLFPTGAANFNGTRIISIKAGNYIGV